MTAGNLLDRGPLAGGGRGVRRWQLRHRGVKESFRGTRTEAKRALAEFVARVDAGRLRVADGTVGQALDDYLQHADMQPKTRVETEGRIKTHLAPLADVKLSKLTPQEIEALCRRLLTEGVDTKHTSRATIPAPPDSATPIDPAALSPKVRAAVGRLGLTAEQVQSMSRAELLALPRIGPQAVRELRAVCGPMRPEWRKAKPKTTVVRRPLSPATVRRTHAVLHAALERAVRLDLINANPASRVQPPSGRRTIDIDIDTADVLAILRAAEDDRRLHTWLVLAAATGCRRGELCALRWRDVDLAAGRLTVRSALSHAGAGTLVEKAPKSGKERTVTLPPSAVDALKAWRRETATVAGWVFPASADGLEPWSPVAVTSAFRRLCRRAGVGGVRGHDLRHWAASANLRAGMSVAEVAQMLGHSSPAVTMAIYSHVVGSARPPMALDDAMKEQSNGTHS